MSTTTIRVDSATHAQLMAMSKASGSSLTETVKQAAEALRRQRYAHVVMAELDALRANPGAWSAYMAEAEATSVSDGLD